MKLGFEVKIVGEAKNAERTTAEDTENLAKKLRNLNMDLILFAGGDGTARNLCKAIGNSIPVVGIPAGVKIHSGVYAVNPVSAGWAVSGYLEKGKGSSIEAEVMDIDEDLYRKGIVSPKLYGYMCIPDNKVRMQNVKSRSHSEAVELDCIATDIIESMEEDIIYLIGAGTTTRNIMEILKLNYTLIGIDAVLNKKLIATDLDEKGIWELIQNKRAKLIITAIGGQGHIFGRGNQQVSPRIIKKIGMENIAVIATKQKLLSISERKLLLDTGDQELDRELTGYIKVVTGLNERTMCKVDVY